MSKYNPFFICFCFIITCPLLAHSVSPYYYMGDNTPTLSSPNQLDSKIGKISLYNSNKQSVVEIDFLNKTITYFDNKDSQIKLDTIPLNSKAFCTVDRKADETPWTSPYSYCMGNPISLIDPMGERPTDVEAATLAQFVYQRGLKGYDIDVSGWIVSSFNTSITKNYTEWMQNGLQSELFERTIDGVKEYAYVFAGTNSLEDILEALAQLIGLAPQYSVAIKNARTLSVELGDLELTFIGHSLGAGEAAAAGMATGRSAITFNPAVLSPLTALSNHLDHSGDIVNFIGAAPPIMGFQFVVDPVTLLQNRYGLFAPGKTVLVPIDFTFNPHSIDSLVKALSKSRP